MQGSRDCEDGNRWTDGVYSRIKSITVSHCSIINGIHVEYHLKGDNDDYVIGAPQDGGQRGTTTLIDLDDGLEFTKIEGYSWKCGDVNQICGDVNQISSLTFTTNMRKKDGPYGSAQGDYFRSNPKGKIVSLYGRSSDYLNQLGFYSQVLK
ncbi:hypothetical protein SUGI_0897510 [Cryptomeria japonica]|nr:hypothetical protein SUGI_0897510 [Cryptomeria japonica]